MMKKYKALGPYIQPVDERNTLLEDLPLMGLSIQKKFIPSIANTIGTDMSTYRIIERNQFAYGPVTSRNGDKITIALFDDHDKALISQAYTPFEVTDTNKLDPEYLMMWFRRPEFDRYARFKSHGSAREIFDWEEMCNVTLPIPHIDKQREIVKEYNVIQNRIALNQQMIQKLEETAQAIYKQWFVEFEFPCLPSDYRPHGQVNLSAEFKSIMTYKKVGGLPIPDGKKWFVYVLLCEDGSFYKGITNDLYYRFYKHYTGTGAEWTQTNKPVKVIHWEQFSSQEEAAKREKELKSGYGRTWLQRQWVKVNGDSPAPECQLRMAGEMVWCEELGKEIPKGWETRDLGLVIDYKKGYAFKSEDYLSCGKEIIRVSDLGQKYLEYSTFYKTKQLPEFEVFKVSYSDLIITTVGSWPSNPSSVVGKLVRIPSFADGYYLNQNMVRIRPLRELREVIYQQLIQKTFSDYLVSGAQGSANQASITLEHTFQYKLLVPNDKKLNLIFEEIYNFIDSKIIENQKLTELKELVLSKLATVEE